MCHIVLGLRPVSSQEEGEIVRGWLEREERRGFSVGQFWYLISIDWWNLWLEYIGFPKSPSQVSLIIIYSVLFKILHFYFGYFGNLKGKIKRKASTKCYVYNLNSFVLLQFL